MTQNLHFIYAFQISARVSATVPLYPVIYVAISSFNKTKQKRTNHLRLDGIEIGAILILQHISLSSYESKLQSSVPRKQL